MIRSMTGYGEASTEHEGVHFFMEVRSLNAKYFKSVIRLPEDLQGLEAELEAELRRRLTRGTITLVGKCTDASAGAAHQINHEALSRYVEQVMQTPQVGNGTVRFDVASLLSLPGVLQSPPDDEEKLHRARAAFTKLLDEACSQVQTMRQREGSALVEELRGHLRLISERLERISGRAPLVVEEYHQRLRSRIESMLEERSVAVEPGDLIREVAVYAERSDIAEEIARLSGHLTQFEELISERSERPLGRTLDFLAQEMLREANTIASKSNDVEISRDIVEIKGAIDRIKEQVQNIE